MRVIRHGYLVELRRVGQRAFPRWFLRDSALRYWTGSDWTPQRTKARTYADETEATNEVARLMIETLPRRFRTSLTIVVDAARDFTIEELRDYLRRNLGWRLKHDRGVSSLDTACFHLEFSFDEVREERDGA